MTAQNHDRTDSAVPPTDAPVDRPHELPDAEEAVHRDADDVAPAPGVGVVTGAQARGVVAYGAIGLCAGLVVGALVALIPMADWSYLARFALFGGVGALGGFVAGAVFGGGHEPETEGEVDVAFDLRDQVSSPDALPAEHMPDQPSSDPAGRR